CGLMLTLASYSIVGQEVPSAPKSADSKASENGPTRKLPAGVLGQPSPQNGLPPAEFKFLPDKNGDLHQILNGPTLEGYLKWVEENRNTPQGPQASAISEVGITGEADDEHATLKVAITVRLNQADQFKRVPLYLNEATLMELPVYTGNGEQELIGK